MTYKAVVSQEDTVTMAICPACKGAALFVVDKFITDEDRSEMDRLKALGFNIASRSLKRAGSVDECACSEASLKARTKKLETQVAPSGKPILSLKRRSV
jgi:hypothetical protein